jgi:single-strand DNA-binding protein
MNSVSLIGNLATEVELRDAGEDRKVGSFLLAVDRPGQQDKADFVRIVTWNRQAEVCAQFLRKGKRVGIEGRLRSHSWDGDDGKRRTVVEIVASSVQFLSGREQGGGEAEVPFEEAAVAS